MTLRELHELGRRDPVAGYYAALAHPDCEPSELIGPWGDDCKRIPAVDVPAIDEFAMLMICAPESERVQIATREDAAG